LKPLLLCLDRLNSLPPELLFNDLGIAVGLLDAYQIAYLHSLSIVFNNGGTPVRPGMRCFQQIILVTQEGHAYTKHTILFDEDLSLPYYYLIRDSIKNGEGQDCNKQDDLQMHRQNESEVGAQGAASTH